MLGPLAAAPSADLGTPLSVLNASSIALQGHPRISSFDLLWTASRPAHRQPGREERHAWQQHRRWLDENLHHRVFDWNVRLPLTG